MRGGAVPRAGRAVVLSGAQPKLEETKESCFERLASYHQMLEEIQGGRKMRSWCARGSRDRAMKLTEALSGSPLAWAERAKGDTWILVHRSRSGYHLTRSTPDAQGRSRSQDWVFASLYDLLVFARAQGFAEVAPEASDWRAVSGSA